MVKYNKILRFLFAFVLITVLYSAPEYIDQISANTVSNTSKSSSSLDSWMPDKALQNAFRKSLGLEANQDFTKDDLLNATNLSLENENLSSWNGIEYAKNIVNLKMTNVSLPTNTSFAKLAVSLTKIQNVTITGSGITGDMLEHFNSNSIETVDFSNNKLNNLDFLKTVTTPNLHSVIVSDNNIDNLSGLNNITSTFPKIVYWEGNNNKISDFTPLAGLKPDQSNPPKGSSQSISDNINLIKPVTNNQTYDIKNIVKTVGIDFSTGLLIKNDTTFSTASVLGHEYSDFGNNYNANNNTLPLSIIDQNNLPTNVYYQFTGTYGYVSGTVNLKLNWQTLDTTDSTIYVDSKWNPSDNYVLTNQSVPFKDIKVEGSVDTKKTGTNKITYSYTDDSGQIISKVATVNVIPSKASIITKDTELIAGPNTKWQASDNFSGAFDQEGKPVDFKDIQVDGTVDTTKAGSYKITYSYTDATGNIISNTATVTVKDLNSTQNNDKGNLNGNTSSMNDEARPSNNKNNDSAIKQLLENTLPKTAAEKVSVLILFGVIIAALSSVLILNKRRNKR